MQNDDRLIYVSDLKKIVSRMVEVPAEMRVRMLGAINRTKTADAAPVVRGRWIHCKGKSNLWYCSECGEKILYNPTRRTYNIEKRSVHEVNKYCRGCGAIMDGGNDDGICEKC